jgi:hypothetical protein
VELADATKSEIARPIATVLIPGAIAVAPYVIVVQHYIPQVLDFWKIHDAAFSAIVVACMLAAGLLLEDLGALLEGFVLDPLLTDRVPDHRENWNKYLKLKIKDEFVGQRYLRTMVTSLKFELAMFPGILCLWFGLLWIQLIDKVWSAWGFAVLTVFLAAVTTYLGVESFLSARTLSNTRRLLIEAYEADGPPA